MKICYEKRASNVIASRVSALTKQPVREVIMANSDTANSSLELQDKTFVLAKCGTRIQISPEDYELVCGRKWHVQILKSGHSYAYSANGSSPIAMHRFILGATKGKIVDHVDNNGLNNSRNNIRLGTQAENMANRGADKRNKLGIKGVSKSGSRFRSAITPNGKQIMLGTFDTEAEAHAAYLGAAKILWGEFSRGK